MSRAPTQPLHGSEAWRATVDLEIKAVKDQFVELKTEMREGYERVVKAVEKLSSARGFTLHHAAFMVALAGAVGGYVSWFTSTTLNPINLQLATIQKTLNDNNIDVMAYRLSVVEAKTGVRPVVITGSAKRQKEASE